MIPPLPPLLSGVGGAEEALVLHVELHVALAVARGVVVEPLRPEAALPVPRVDRLLGAQGVAHHLGQEEDPVCFTCVCRLMFLNDWKKTIASHTLENSRGMPGWGRHFCYWGPHQSFIAFLIVEIDASICRGIPIQNTKKN